MCIDNLPVLLAFYTRKLNTFRLSESWNQSAMDPEGQRSVRKILLTSLRLVSSVLAGLPCQLLGKLSSCSELLNDFLLMCHTRFRIL